MDIRKRTIGRERAPLLVIDDFFEVPRTLIRQAVPKHFGDGGRSFPGIRARAPLSYQRFLANELRGVVLGCRSTASSTRLRESVLPVQIAEAGM